MPGDLAPESSESRDTSESVGERRYGNGRGGAGKGLRGMGANVAPGLAGGAGRGGCGERMRGGGGGAARGGEKGLRLSAPAGRGEALLRRAALMMFRASSACS